MKDPAPDGVNVTWQDAAPEPAPVPVASVQLPAPVNAPVLGEVVNMTVPVGVLAALAAVSVTVAVHVLASPVLSDAGVQAMAVETVSRLVSNAPASQAVSPLPGRGSPR